MERHHTAYRDVDTMRISHIRPNSIEMRYNVDHAHTHPSILTVVRTDCILRKTPFVVGTCHGRAMWLRKMCCPETQMAPTHCTIHWLSGTTNTLSIEHHSHEDNFVPAIHFDKLSPTQWQRTRFLHILACPEETLETLEGQVPTEETEEPLRTPSALSGGTLTPIP